MKKYPKTLAEPPYTPPNCSRCGGTAKVEYNGQYRSSIRSRVRCVKCDRCTDWRMTRFQAEIEWEEMCERVIVSV